MAKRVGSPWAYAGTTGGITDTTDVAIKAAASGFRNYLSALQYINTSATASEIVVKDDTTVIWRGYAPASGTMVNSLIFDPPLQSSNNKALNVALITTGSATRVSAQGFVDS